MSLATMAEHTSPDKATLRGLRTVLAGLVVETAKAQTYHWNVKGMSFGLLHSLFQEIYEDHFAAQDDLAERIKAIGAHADGRLSSSLGSSVIEECDGNISAREMVEKLANDQQMLSGCLLDLARAANQEGDDVTNDMAIGRAGVHDKFAWILRAHLEG